MADERQREGSLLTGYTVQVYAGGDVADRERERVTEAVDDELHDHLFMMARRLQRLFGVYVVAVDEEGTRWIASDLSSRPARSSGRAPRRRT
jgi:hypothetical protein